jgi:hypothetical protein
MHLSGQGPTLVKLWEENTLRVSINCPTFDTNHIRLSAQVNETGANVACFVLTRKYIIHL